MAVDFSDTTRLIADAQVADEGQPGSATTTVSLSISVNVVE
jgi:hypothetical protein